MPYAWTAMLLAICVSIVASRDDVNGQAARELSPKAAEQYASDSEKAAGGDPDAAYRLGEALESGRFGGLKDLNKALSFYRLAAQNGHKQAAARALQIEVELEQSRKKAAAGPDPDGTLPRNTPEQVGVAVADRPPLLNKPKDATEMPYLYC